MNNRPRKILLVAAVGAGSVGPSFVRAFAALGHEVTVINHRKYFPFTLSAAGRITGRLLKKAKLRQYNRDILQNVCRVQPEIMVVMKGVNLEQPTLRSIKERLPRTVLVNINYDDYFSPSPGNIFHQLGDLILCYDFFFPSKRVNVPELLRRGAGQVHYLPIGYDPEVHFPVQPDLHEYLAYRSQIAFIGTYTRERAQKLAQLKGYKLHIRGGHWKKWKVEPGLRRYLKPGIAAGMEFSKIVNSAEISLNFFRKENRDTHNQRTFELPACRAFCLSQRSEELGQFFVEDREIAAFGSDEELKDKTAYYLAHEKERRAMAEAAYRRLRKEKHTIQDRAETILNAIDQHAG